MGPHSSPKTATSMPPAKVRTLVVPSRVMIPDPLAQGSIPIMVVSLRQNGPTLPSEFGFSLVEACPATQPAIHQTLADGEHLPPHSKVAATSVSLSKTRTSSSIQPFAVIGQVKYGALTLSALPKPILATTSFRTIHLLSRMLTGASTL